MFKTSQNNGPHEGDKTDYFLRPEYRRAVLWGLAV